MVVKIIFLILIFLVSFLVTYSSLDFVKNKSIKFGLLDYPNNRKIHSSPLTRLGGISMIFGFCASFLFLNFINKNLFYLDFNSELVDIIILPLILFFLIGLTDDIFKLSPLTRLILQLSVSSIAWFNGLRIENIDISFINNNIQYLSLPIYLSFLVTIVWISGITNAINWLDGLDGLATSFSSTILFSIAIYCFLNGNFTCGILCILILGTSLGFLPKNKSPASIYMGDGGSYFLGFSLATISLISAFPTTSNTFIIQNLPINFLIPLFFLAVPIIDMLYVICSRMSEGKSPLYPDNRHIHYRLLRTGINTNTTVIIICIIGFWISSLTLFFLNLDNNLLLFIPINIICLLTIKTKINRKSLNFKKSKKIIS